MRVNFYKQCWQFFMSKRLLLHAFILLYGLLIVVVSMTQTTTAYFQDSETIEGSIQMASDFEEPPEAPANLNSEADANSLDKSPGNENTTERIKVESSSDGSETNNDASEETGLMPSKDINDSGDEKNDEDDFQSPKQETEDAEIDNGNHG